MCIRNWITFSGEELLYPWWAELLWAMKPLSMEWFWFADTVICVHWILMCCHAGRIFYFSGELLHPQRAELVLTIRPTGMEQLCITDANIYVSNDIFRVLVLNWFFFQYKPSLCTVGRAGASHKACTNGTVQHDWYNHVNDNNEFSSVNPCVSMKHITYK